MRSTLESMIGDLEEYAREGEKVVKWMKLNQETVLGTATDIDSGTNPFFPPPRPSQPNWTKDNLAKFSQTVELVRQVLHSIGRPVKGDSRATAYNTIEILSSYNTVEAFSDKYAPSQGNVGTLDVWQQCYDQLTSVTNFLQDVCTFEAVGQATMNQPNPITSQRLQEELSGSGIHIKLTTSADQRTRSQDELKSLRTRLLQFVKAQTNKGIVNTPLLEEATRQWASNLVRTCPKIVSTDANR
ncbi:hypothetical protein TREMEDRAFT_59153 [Tremella mesenterica DSM 1558]|uniref:uncharacterized protein n=1 Tax=Tremella mesenterica (strain ATCC 24925 / CBS 8224 / DSM 1558 / NBRC 9311 / NRRL Y-6157 / RJB 2259-6 / UBC 559-6) TaxID=578456 RepID=UPI0003F48E79|nr:uncharacterized protein TREMEDRAFT_59153 [Tremella mesenterica DSM 1558]EIW72993.1 hypothetical protein TREMEDRAFT_59153 [Tremella mesenterica DSM 1558]